MRKKSPLPIKTSLVGYFFLTQFESFLTEVLAKIDEPSPTPIHTRINDAFIEISGFIESHRHKIDKDYEARTKMRELLKQTKQRYDKQNGQIQLDICTHLKLLIKSIQYNTDELKLQRKIKSFLAEILAEAGKPNRGSRTKINNVFHQLKVEFLVSKFWIQNNHELRAAIRVELEKEKLRYTKQENKTHCSISTELSHLLNDLNSI